MLQGCNYFAPQAHPSILYNTIFSIFYGTMKKIVINNNPTNSMHETKSKEKQNLMIKLSLNEFQKGTYRPHF